MTPEETESILQIVRFVLCFNFCVLALFVIVGLLSIREPKHKNFRCTGCGLLTNKCEGGSHMIYGTDGLRCCGGEFRPISVFRARWLQWSYRRKE